MAFDFTGALNVAGGLLGLFGKKKKDPYQEAAAGQLNLQNQLNRKMMNLADSYNPADETTQAIDYAQKSTGKSLTTALRNLEGDYKAAGGNPSGSTAYAWLTQRKVDDLLNPLSSFAAQSKAQEFSKKLAAYQAAGSGSPGQLANSYMNLSGMSKNADTSAAQNMLAQGIQAFFPQKAGAQMSQGANPQGSPAGEPTPYNYKPGTLKAKPNFMATDFAKTLGKVYSG